MIEKHVSARLTALRHRGAMVARLNEQMASGDLEGRDVRDVDLVARAGEIPADLSRVSKVP